MFIDDFPAFLWSVISHQFMVHVAFVFFWVLEKSMEWCHRWEAVLGPRGKGKKG